eukprot:Nitzschia sp. Nitz4//scaffold238_size30058//28406//29867//NITZ4_008008-RA/size30058-augustus-gene-0.20-mRNA-1//-1//CDS//3329543555//7360//frame0
MVNQTPLTTSYAEIREREREPEVSSRRLSMEPDATSHLPTTTRESPVPPTFATTTSQEEATPYHSLPDDTQAPPPTGTETISSSQPMQQPLTSWNDSHSTASSSLGVFFAEFWDEFTSLITELIAYSKAKTWKKKVLTFFLGVSGPLVLYDLFFGHYIVDILAAFIHWMTNHSTYAVISFVGIFVVSTLLFIPPTLLIFGAGYAFSQAIGMGWGIIAAIFSCFIGSCIGAVIAFLRSRYMMRDLIHLFSKRYPLVRAADRALKRKGFKIVLLLRLCPLIPFNALNHLCGITGVRLEEFALSLVGVLPFQIFTVIVGATTGSLILAPGHQADHYNELQHLGWIILLASGVGFGLVALVYTWKTVKKELRKELDMTSEELDQCLHPDQHKHRDDSQTSNVEMKPTGTHHTVDPENPFAEEGEADYEWQVEGEEWYWVWA